MIIEKFVASGETYTFPTTLLVDSFEATRPSIVAPVSGASGVFDFYSTYANPIAPITVTKTFAKSATTSAAIDDERNLILSKIVEAPEGLLYALDRDGSTGYYTPAKCVGFSAGETYQEKGRFLKTFTLTFFCRYGIWQDSDGSIQSGPMGISEGAGTGEISVASPYAGRLNAYATIRFKRDSGTLTDISFTNTDAGCSLRWQGSCGAGDTININTQTYKIYHELSGADAYSELTPSQLCWWWLQPGRNRFSYNLVGGDMNLYVTYPKGLFQL
jgi:hypothetical protein